MRPRRIFAYFKKEMPLPRPCDHNDCKDSGLFRAPKSREQLREYYWFCLNHVRDYNKKWDYYAGMSLADIENAIRQDTVWEKPSWPLRGNPYAKMNPHFQFFDETESAHQRQTENNHYSQSNSDPRPTHIIVQERQALQQLELNPPASLMEIKAQYKKLAKQHHPDLNQHDPNAEDRLKEINRAYQFLKTHALDAVKTD